MLDVREVVREVVLRVRGQSELSDIPNPIGKRAIKKIRRLLSQEIEKRLKFDWWDVTKRIREARSTGGDGGKEVRASSKVLCEVILELLLCEQEEVSA